MTFDKIIPYFCVWCSLKKKQKGINKTEELSLRLYTVSDDLNTYLCKMFEILKIKDAAVFKFMLFCFTLHIIFICR